MGDLLIRNVPEQLKRELERAARQAGQSLSSKSIDLLRKSLAEEAAEGTLASVSAWDALRPLLYSAGGDAEAEAFAKTMDEIEAERKRDFGVPVDFE